MKIKFVFRTFSWAIAGFTSAAMAQNPGAFTPTGSMSTPRAAHRATLLNNGKVLITGGTAGSGSFAPLASAEIYDPATGAFTPTGNMTKPREQHDATLLADGRVLISGGTADFSAELYDPASGTFTATGDMVALPYSWLQATSLLRDGRVFVAGQPGGQLYDPLTGKFAATSAYADLAPEFMETVTLLPDGRVLLTGGGEIIGWAEVYDPAADAFSRAGSEFWWDDVNRAVVLANGTVLFVGNDDYGVDDAELFDPAITAFTQIGRATEEHEYGAASLLPDGTVLVTGGELPGGNGDVHSELYSPSAGTFSPIANMNWARSHHTATLLADGTLLITGGYSIWPSSTAAAELYRPKSQVSAPALFSLSGDGNGQGAIWNSISGQIASSSTPAAAGDVLSMYTTSLIEGGVIPPQVAIGGRLAEILFFGDAPGYPGYNQVNFRVPSGIVPGPAVSVRLTYLNRSSNAVAIGVQ